MANTKKTTKENIEETEIAKNEVIVNDSLQKENEELKDRLSKMEEQMAALAKLMENQSAQVQTSNVQYIDTTSKMDKPCTIIHMFQAHPDLPNTINCRGNVYNFHDFGQKKTVRFEEFQDIMHKYKRLFERGMFTLGEDCIDYADNYGIKVMNMPMTVKQFDRIAEIDLSEFKNIIESINPLQRVFIADIWKRRYNEGREEYRNLDKIKILNDNIEGNTFKDIIYELIAN